MSVCSPNRVRVFVLYCLHCAKSKQTLHGNVNRLIIRFHVTKYQFWWTTTDTSYRILYFLCLYLCVNRLYNRILLRPTLDSTCADCHKWQFVFCFVLKVLWDKQTSSQCYKLYVIRKYYCCSTELSIHSLHEVNNEDFKTKLVSFPKRIETDIYELERENHCCVGKSSNRKEFNGVSMQIFSIHNLFCCDISTNR